MQHFTIDFFGGTAICHYDEFEILTPKFIWHDLLDVGGKIVIKLVGICGSRVKQGNMEAFLDVAMNHARQHQDVEAESIALWGGKDSHLPLTPEIVESLLDYLQKSRPSYSCRVDRFLQATRS